jgi:hypothetical protein
MGQGILDRSGTHRAFAIRATDHNDWKIRMKIESLFDLRHALKNKRNGFRVERFEVG